MFEVQRKNYFGKGDWYYTNVALFKNEEDAKKCVEVLIDMERNVDGGYIEIGGPYPTFQIVNLESKANTFIDWLKDYCHYGELDRDYNGFEKLYAFRNKYRKYIAELENK